MAHQPPAQANEGVWSVSDLQQQLDGLNSEVQELKQQLQQTAPGSVRYEQLQKELSIVRQEKLEARKQLIRLQAKNAGDVGSGAGEGEGGGAGAEKIPIVEDFEWLAAALQQQLQRWKQAWHGGYWKLGKHE